MSSPADQPEFSEFADLSFFQGAEGLDDVNLDAFEMPDFATMATFEALPTPTAVQSPVTTSKPLPASPPRLPRRTSVVTVRRRSSARSNKTVFSVTFEDPNGRKGSMDITVATDECADWLQSLSPDTLNRLNQSFTAPSPGQTLPIPRSPPFPTQFLAQQPSPCGQQMPYVAPYMPVANPSFQFVGQQPLLPQQPLMVPQAPRYTGHVPAAVRSGRLRTRRSAMQSQHQLVPARPVPQRRGIGGRPPLPDDIQPFVNPGQLPQNHGRVPDKRGNKDTTVANDFYYSISSLPDLELPINGMAVAYNGVEFEPSLRFTGEEFLEYTHWAVQRPNRHPILRIQIQPAQYNHRYKRAGESFKCRFSSCPVKKGTILKGQARVCISEFADEHGDWLNPFHNAGYVHLDCLEKQVNLIELYCSEKITIIPETRSLHHEPPATTSLRTNNPMALNDVERTVVHEWFEEMSARWEEFVTHYPDPATRPHFDLEQKDRLTYRLTKAHGDNKVLKRVQERRKLQAGGRVTAHLDEFVGDLGKQVALHNKMKKQPPRTKVVERRESVVSPAPKRRRISRTVQSAIPMEPEAQVPMQLKFADQDDLYLSQPQDFSNAVGALHLPLPSAYNAPPSIPAAAHLPFNPPVQSMPFEDMLQFFNAPHTPSQGTPRHAQRRPSPIKVLPAPTCRPSSAVVTATKTHAGVGARRRSSARLAARASVSSSASLGVAQEAWLEGVAEGVGEAQAESTPVPRRASKTSIASCSVAYEAYLDNEGEAAAEGVRRASKTVSAGVGAACEAFLEGGAVPGTARRVSKTSTASLGVASEALLEDVPEGDEGDGFSLFGEDESRFEEIE